MLHEAHTGPLASLFYNPRIRYYGAATTSTFYPVVLSELWRWTGDKSLVVPLLKPEPIRNCWRSLGDWIRGSSARRALVWTQLTAQKNATVGASRIVIHLCHPPSCLSGSKVYSIFAPTPRLHPVRSHSNQGCVSSDPQAQPVPSSS